MDKKSKKIVSNMKVKKESSNLWGHCKSETRVGGVNTDLYADRMPSLPSFKKLQKLVDPIKQDKQHPFGVSAYNTLGS